MAAHGGDVVARILGLTLEPALSNFQPVCYISHYAKPVSGFGIIKRDEASMTYTKPELKMLGTVVDKTLTGLTNPGGDNKAGSRPSNGQ